MKHEKPSLAVGLRWKRILAVIVLIIYQVAGQLVLSKLVIDHAETQCIDRLHDATTEFSSTYYDHAMSDREQLRVVADMLSVLMAEDTHDLSIHLAAFEQRGMLDWLQVLLPDGTLITGSGTYDATPYLSYQEEASHLPSISNVSAGLVDTSKQVIRSSVPITENGETIAILYGVYDLTAGHVLDGVKAYEGKAYTFVMEADTGNYILDGLRSNASTGLTGLSYTPKPGYDLDALAADLAACREGFSAFRSHTLDGYMYIYYAPIGINNWMAMVSVPEDVALAYAYESRDFMLCSIAYISLGVMLYFIVIHFVDQQVQDKSAFVSRIQSQLMEVYHKPEYFHDALLAVCKRAQSDAVFLIDELLPRSSAIVGSNDQLVEAYKQHNPELADQLLALCRHQRKAVRLHQKNRILRQYPALLRFLQEHKQTTLVLSPIVTPEGTIHQVMGAFNPENLDTPTLLDTVTVDFFMAANNIDYLTRLEIAGTVDTLTGAMNRTSYHLRLDELYATNPEGLACVYIDVNDLHAINNRYGHEKGDAMLRSIAGALMDAFEKRNVFRFGGDEFVILTKGVTSEWLDAMTAQADAAIRAEGYTVSIGAVWEEHPTDIDALIRNAESAMYKAKYQFYQEKEKLAATPSLEHKSVRRLLTENADVDAFLQVAENHYQGVYIVNLITDEVREILARSYFYTSLHVAGQSFSSAFHHYIAEVVDKQSRRSIQNFFVPEQINAQIAAGQTPIVEYTKADGERIRLTVYASPHYSATLPETIWVFEGVHKQ